MKNITFVILMSFASTLGFSKSFEDNEDPALMLGAIRSVFDSYMASEKQNLKEANLFMGDALTKAMRGNFYINSKADCGDVGRIFGKNIDEAGENGPCVLYFHIGLTENTGWVYLFNHAHNHTHINQLLMVEDHFRLNERGEIKINIGQFPAEDFIQLQIGKKSVLRREGEATSVEVTPVNPVQFAAKRTYRSKVYDCAKVARDLDIPEFRNLGECQLEVKFNDLENYTLRVLKNGRAAINWAGTYSLASTPPASFKELSISLNPHTDNWTLTGTLVPWNQDLYLHKRVEGEEAQSLDLELVK